MRFIFIILGLGAGDPQDPTRPRIGAGFEVWVHRDPPGGPLGVPLGPLGVSLGDLVGDLGRVRGTIVVTLHDSHREETGC